MKCFIRADANTQIGSGHVMRCLAPGQAWQARGGEVTFITACASDPLCQRLSAEGFEVVALRQAHPHPNDWATLSQVIAAQPQGWVVLEGC